MISLTDKLAAFLIIFVLVGAEPHLRAATVAESSQAWRGLSGDYDFIGDSQTGKPEGDAVGSSSTGDFGLLVTFNDGGSTQTDGTFGFRLRVDAAGGNANTPDFSSAALLGIDADANDSIDVFVGVNFSGNKKILGIFDPGTGANTGPSTTSVSSTPVVSYVISESNYNYRPVDFTTDGGTTNNLNPSAKKPEVDYYLSVMVDFADIASYLSNKQISVTDQSPLRFVSATSTQGNSLNQDILGIDDKTFVDTGQTWSQTGGMTDFLSANEIKLVPETCAFSLMGVGLGCLFMKRRRR